MRETSHQQEGPVLTHQSEIPFDSYIHGTSSSALPILFKSEFRLSSAIKLVENYGLAPLGGELGRGGYRIASDQCYPCFGRLNADKGYTLDDVIARYAKICGKTSTLKRTERELKDYSANGFRDTFFFMPLMLIYLARYRVLGGDLLDIESIKLLKRKLVATIQYFYLYLIVERDISPNYDAINEHAEANRYLSLITMQHFTVEGLLSKILAENPDLEPIYNKPSKDSENDVLKLLELPKSTTIDWMSWNMRAWTLNEEDISKEEEGKEVTLSCTQPFKYEPNSNQLKNDSSQFSLSHILITRYNSSLYCIYFGRDDGAVKSNPPELSGLRDHWLEYIDTLKRHLDTLNKLMSEPKKPLVFDEPLQKLIDEDFPLVFVYDNDHHMEPNGWNEYRTQQSLKVGIDIKTVATDSKPHQDQLREFFLAKGVEVNVILFDDLYKQRELIRGSKDVVKPEPPKILDFAQKPKISEPDLKAEAPSCGLFNQKLVLGAGLSSALIGGIALTLIETGVLAGIGGPYLWPIALGLTVLGVSLLAGLSLYTCYSGSSFFHSNEKSESEAAYTNYAIDSSSCNLT